MMTSDIMERVSKKASAPPTVAHGPRVGDLNVFDTHLGVWEDCPVGRPDEEGMRRTFRVMLDVLRSRGFIVTPDSLFRDGFIGRKGDLEFAADTGGRMAKVEFHQNINFENPNGGRYDFDKFQKMPLPMRYASVVELAAVAKMLIDLGYTLGPKIEAKGPLLWRLFRTMAGKVGADDSPLERFNRSWTAERFARDETGWPTSKEIGGYGNQTDADKQPLQCGDTRYFRQRGRLVRGTVYPNMGNVWTVYTGGTVTSEATFRLFSCDPTQVPRRYVPGQIKRVRAELQKAITANNFDRVAVLAKVCKRMSTEPLYYLLSLKYSKKDEPALTWWAIDSAGYTYKIANAGLYTAAEAAGRGGDGTIAIASEAVSALAVDGVVSREHLRKLKAMAVKSKVKAAKPGSTS